jgi:hypothetical protein
MANQERDGTGNEDGGQQRRIYGCFLCNKPHPIWDCPRRATMDALMEPGTLATLVKAIEANTRAAGFGGIERNKEEHYIGAFSCDGVTPVKDMPERTKQKKGKGGAQTLAMMRHTTSKGKTLEGLMYVDIQVNGKPVRAMVNTGASYNYLASPIVRLCTGEGYRLGEGCELDG